MPERFSTEKISHLLMGFFETATGPDVADRFHHLLLATPGVTAVGAPTLSVKLGMLVPVGLDEDPADFICRSVAGMAVDECKESGSLYLAGLILEGYAVAFTDPDEVAENRLRRELADYQIHTRPDAVELSEMYAIDADGRRYSMARWHTGPAAGKTGGMTVSTAADPPGTGADRGWTAHGGHGSVDGPGVPLVREVMARFGTRDLH